MRLLVLTQKVDHEDDVLGFFHRWLEAFASVFAEIIAVCLEKGAHQLPSNVRVFSLGKEERKSRWQYVKRFFQLIVRERKNYSAVFVHMNPEYVILGAVPWKLWGKKIFLWYNHTFGTWRARLAFLLADRVLHTSPFAYSAGRKKSVRMAAGIDTDLFKPDVSAQKIPNSILYLGRIAPVKRVEVLVEAVKILESRGEKVSLNIYGEPLPRDSGYFKHLKNLSAPLERKGVITFVGKVPNYETPGVYSRHTLFVNLTPSGNYDKTVLEALACRTPAIVSSLAFAADLPPELVFMEGNAADLASKISSLLNFPGKKRDEITDKLREYVIREQSLMVLTEQLTKLYGHP